MPTFRASTYTAVEPNWWAAASLQTKLAELLKLPSNMALNWQYNGHVFELQRTAAGDSVVQVITGIPEELPTAWDDVPLHSILLVNNQSPETRAHDGEYYEVIDMCLGVFACMRARVNTELTDGGSRAQTIRVRLYVQDASGGPRPATPYLHQLTGWYDQLRAGHKNGLASVSVAFQNQPNIDDTPNVEELRRLVAYIFEEKPMMSGPAWWAFRKIAGILNTPMPPDLPVI